MNWSDDNHSRWKEDELRRAAKIDGNQNAIRDALEAMGVFVESLAAVGNGCPDLLCIVPQATYLLECKMPGGTYRPKQKEWHEKARHRVHIVYDIESAIAITKGYLARNKLGKADDSGL